LPISASEAQRDYIAIRQTGLYRHLLERRRQIRDQQLVSLVHAAVASTDPTIRAIAASIVADSSLWQYLDLLENQLSAQTPPVLPESEKAIGDYDLPEFVLDAPLGAGDYTP